MLDNPTRLRVKEGLRTFVDVGLLDNGCTVAEDVVSGMECAN